jgi:hypothetical protein
MRGASRWVQNMLYSSWIKQAIKSKSDDNNAGSQTKNPKWVEKSKSKKIFDLFGGNLESK